MTSESGEHAEPRLPGRWRSFLPFFGVLVVVVVVVGTVGNVVGAGWFGYRAWWYEGGQLYALNLSPEPLWVAVDGGERVKVPSENAEIVDLLGGESVVTVTDASGATVATYEVMVDRSHALLKLTDDGCLAAVDITPFYTGTSGGELKFRAHLREETRVWIAQSRNVVWPRKDFLARLEGGEGDGLWFEIVACELLDEQEFLDPYLSVRLESRMAKALGKDKNR